MPGPCVQPSKSHFLRIYFYPKLVYLNWSDFIIFFRCSLIFTFEMSTNTFTYIALKRRIDTLPCSGQIQLNKIYV